MPARKRFAAARVAGRFVFPFIAVLLLASLSWGSPIHVGAVEGLEIQVAFKGYQGVERGEFVFARGAPVRYELRIRNRGNATLAGVDVQASLRSNGAACESGSLSYGTPLPGAALSPQHRINLSPGESYAFEVGYNTPPTLCPSSGHLNVRVQYTRSGLPASQTLTSPAHIRFR